MALACCGRVGGTRDAGGGPAIAPACGGRCCPNRRRAAAHRGDAVGHRGAVIAASHRSAAVRLRCRPGLRAILRATPTRPGGAGPYAAYTRDLQCNDCAHLWCAVAVPDTAAATDRHDGGYWFTVRTSARLPVCW